MNNELKDVTGATFIARRPFVRSDSEPPGVHQQRVGARHDRSDLQAPVDYHDQCS